MKYIIIGLVVLVIVIFLAKHVLFNPRVNSIIHMVFLIMVTVAAIMNPSPLTPLKILLAVNIIDCIRDIIVAKTHYADIEIEVDRLYMIKSLSWAVLLAVWFISSNPYVLLLVFAPRIVYLFAVYPIIAHLVSRDVKRKLAASQPLPYYSDQYGGMAAKGYYFSRKIRKLSSKGLLTANSRTVDAEVAVRKARLADLYPEKLVAKLADFFAGDSEKKDMRKEAEKKLNASATEMHKAYVSFALYQQYQTKILEALLARKRTFSPWKIKEFEELGDLKLTIPVGVSRSVEWSEYFIIQVLTPLVNDGVITDFQCSDEPMSNHQYGVEIKSIDANVNPLLALDD